MLAAKLCPKIRRAVAVDGLPGIAYRANNRELIPRTGEHHLDVKQLSLF